MGVAQVPLSLYLRVYRDRVRILEKVLKLVQQFSRPFEKVWKIKIKSGKMVKSFDFFFKATTSALQVSSFFFVLVESYSTSPVRLHCVMKKSFVPAFFKVSVNHLFDNLESGKRNYSFGKSLE